LHQQLSYLATKEGISLNQYIVYALTRQVLSNYLVKALSETEINQQKKDFQELLDDLGTADSEEINSFLSNREKVEPEAELTEDVLKKFHNLINN
jgi:HicB family